MFDIEREGKESLKLVWGGGRKGELEVGRGEISLGYMYLKHVLGLNMFQS
jgi:hypothetical protein